MCYCSMAPMQFDNIETHMCEENTFSCAHLGMFDHVEIYHKSKLPHDNPFPVGENLMKDNSIIDVKYRFYRKLANILFNKIRIVK